MQVYIQWQAPPQPPIPANWERPAARRVDEQVAAVHFDSSSESEMSDCTWTEFNATVDSKLDIPVRPDGELTVGCVLLVVLDWMASHHTTNSCASDMIKILQLVVQLKPTSLLTRKCAAYWKPTKAKLSVRFQPVGMAAWPTWISTLGRKHCAAVPIVIRAQCAL